MDMSEVIKYIQNSAPDSAVYIGADSRVFKDKKKKQRFVRYTLVIIIHHGQRSGCKLFWDEKIEPFYGSLKQRLLNEVYYTVEHAVQIVDVIGKRKMEVHLDINPDVECKSSVAVQEAIGYVRAMGLVPKVKPDAFAATCVADHRT